MVMMMPVVLVVLQGTTCSTRKGCMATTGAGTAVGVGTSSRRQHCGVAVMQRQGTTIAIAMANAITTANGMGRRRILAIGT